MLLRNVRAIPDNQLAQRLLSRAFKSGLTNTNQLAMDIGVDQESLDRILTTDARPNKRTRARYTEYLDAPLTDQVRIIDRPRKTRSDSGSGSPLERRVVIRRSGEASEATNSLTRVVQALRDSIVQFTALLPSIDLLESQIRDIENDHVLMKIRTATRETRDAVAHLLRNHETGRLQHPRADVVPTAKRSATAGRSNTAKNYSKSTTVAQRPRTRR